MTTRTEGVGEAAPPIYGLVLAGGSGSRLPGDKAALVIHGKPQARWMAGELEKLCAGVFISRAPGQAAPAVTDSIRVIEDQFTGLGPLGGVLTAMTQYPDAAWLVAACDMPFCGAEVLRKLIEARDPRRIATAFVRADGTPEPLCTLYEPGARAALIRAIDEGHASLRRVLEAGAIEAVGAPEPPALISVNTKADYEAALEQIRGRT